MITCDQLCQKTLTTMANVGNWRLTDGWSWLILQLLLTWMSWSICLLFSLLQCLLFLVECNLSEHDRHNIWNSCDLCPFEPVPRLNERLLQVVSTNWFWLFYGVGLLTCDSEGTMLGTFLAMSRMMRETVCWQNYVGNSIGNHVEKWMRQNLLHKYWEHMLETVCSITWPKTSPVHIVYGDGWESCHDSLQMEACWEPMHKLAQNLLLYSAFRAIFDACVSGHCPDSMQWQKFNGCHCCDICFWAKHMQSII